jgi:rSAM/selenodomain-associated transferase 2
MRVPMRAATLAGMTLPLSIVIPTLNAEACIAAAVRAHGDATAEVVVADGGSEDGTVAAAVAAGARVVIAPRGRGQQLAAGAAAATADWLLFLHADTRLADGWSAEAGRFIADPANALRAAYFSLRLDDDAPAARRVERLAMWRSHALGLPYGDQGLLLSRALYDAVGGFRQMVLYEDVDIVRRIGRARLAMLASPAVTSAVRYRRGGYWARPARNITCLALYFLGLPPQMIARLYG